VRGDGTGPGRGRIVAGAVMAAAGLAFLVVGIATGDMWFFGEGDSGGAGRHRWATDPTGYLMAATMWGLFIAVGAILLAQGLRGRTRRG